MRCYCLWMKLATTGVYLVGQGNDSCPFLNVKPLLQGLFFRAA